MKATVLCGVMLVLASGAAGVELNVRPQRIAVVRPQPLATVTNEAALEGKWHCVRRFPSPKAPKIHFYNKLNPIWWFQNADDPDAPEWFRPGEKGREFKWFLRNPFHNFTFYVIGVADKEFVRSGRYPRRTSNPNGGWMFAVTRRRILPLPYWSYRRGRFEFYLGWRVQGNFGIKFNWKGERARG